MFANNAASDISVLTPYRKQKAQLRQMFNEISKTTGIQPRDICTTDEFQGLQNRIIIISLVASGNMPSLHMRDAGRITV